MSDSLIHLSAGALSARLSSGEFSSTELVRALLDRVDAVTGRVRAFLHLHREDALAQAAASDARRAAGEARGPLDGLPVGVKDVIAVKGQPLTAASRILANFVSPYDATVTSKLREAGAIIFGRLNM